MSNDGHEGQHVGRGTHNSPLANDLPPKPEPWRPQVKGWFNTAGYNGPVRPEKPQTAPDEALLRAADAVAARRRNEYGSFVEAAAALAAANAASARRRPRTSA
jgi:hypothetical protein